MRGITISNKLTLLETKSFKQYLKEISSIKPFLNADKEYECAVKCSNGDDKAKDELIKRNLRFVVSVAKQYTITGVSLEDLVNVGNIGMINSASSFDPTQGFKFISYAVWYIRKEIITFMSEKCRTIKLPTNKVNDVNKFNARLTKLEQKLQRPAEDIDMLREFSEYSLNKIHDLMFLGSKNMSSLDANINQDGSSFSRYDLIEDNSLPKVEDITNNQDEKKLIKTIMSILDDREKEILNRHYGLDGQYPESLTVIADELNVTSEYIRQKRNRALLKIRVEFNISL
jgi:RNA polymerase primary sigma factor